MTITKRDIEVLHAELLRRHGQNCTVEGVRALLLLEQTWTALADIGMSLDAATDILLSTRMPNEEICEHVLRLDYIIERLKAEEAIRAEALEEEIRLHRLAQEEERDEEDQS